MYALKENKYSKKLNIMPNVMANVVVMINIIFLNMMLRRKLALVAKLQVNAER